MTLKPVTNSSRLNDPNAEFYVAIEPKADVGDDTILDLLERLHASEVSVLSPGFVSAKIKRRDLPLIDPYGVVNIKAQSRIQN